MELDRGVAAYHSPMMQPRQLHPFHYYYYYYLQSHVARDFARIANVGSFTQSVGNKSKS